MPGNSLNLLYIHQYFETPEQFGGLRTYKNALHLVKQGHKVTVVSGASSYHTGAKTETAKVIRRREEIDGIQVVWLNTLFRYHRSFLDRAMSFAAFMMAASWAGLSIGSDVVYATSPPLTVIIPAFLISRLKRAKLIFEVRDIWPESAITTGVLGNPLLISMAQHLEQFAYRVSNRIVAVSDGIRNALVKNGIDSSKMRVVPHGADLEYFRKGEYDREFRSRYNLDDKFVALYAGSFGWANALEYVVEASYLLRHFENIRIVLLGDGKEKERLRSMANEYHLENLIFAEPVPKKDVGSVIRTADVGLMVLRKSETFATVLPNKLLDYLAAGLPVIINFEGFASSIVEKAGAGILVAPDSAESIAEGLVQLSKDHISARSIGFRGREFVERFYSRESQVREFEKVVCDGT